MRWKKIVIAAALVFVVLITALYTFVEFYDFGKFKPLIAKAVKEATGRELNITGDIEIDFGIRPTIVVEDVSFQNASWSKRPDLGRVKRLEAQIVVWPLLLGKFDFAHLVLVEPDVIVEFDSAGTSNFAFDADSEEKDESEIPPPPLTFSDIRIEKGLFTYKDAQSDFKFSVGIDRLAAKIPGFDEPLQLDFKGAFDDKPLTLKGTVGPIWAWVEPGYPLPVDMAVGAGGATAQVKGELRDPTKLKNITLAITAEGTSIAKITKLAGVNGVPELGAFKVKAGVTDAAGSLAVEKLDIQIGNQELAAISLTGELRDVIALQGVSLDISAQGQDSANLTRLGLPALPERGAFQVNAQITDPEAKVYTVNDLRIVLGDNEIDGQVDLNLAENVPFLTAGLTSQRFRYGQLNLDLKMTNPFEKPAIEKLDLKIGNPDLATIQLNGKVDDLMELQGVDINFQSGGKNLANLKQLTGQPFPVRGAFSAAGKVLIPVHKNLKIPDLKISAGKNNIAGTLNLDLSGDKPQLEAKLSLPKLDLPSVLLPQLAKEGWAKGLSQVSPVKIDVTLNGFAQEIALKKVDLQAGTLKSAEFRLTGSVENLMAQRGIDLKFSLRGKELAKLKEIIAQPYIFAPVPGQGDYAISGYVSDPNPTAKVYMIKDFKLTVADTKLNGRLDINLAGQLPVYEVQLSGPKFNLKPFPIPKEAAYANLNKIEDLGPLKLHSKIIVEGDQLSLSQVEIQAGTEQIAAVQVKGSIKNLTSQRGINLNLNIKGKEVANLAKLTGQSLPLKGPYSISGKLADPAQKKYKLSDLNFKLGKNDITGSLDLNLNGKKLGLATNLAAPKFTLQPVTLPALETLARIEDLGPLGLAFKLAGAGKKITLENLDFKLGRKDLIEVVLKGTISDLAAVKGMKLEFSAKSSNMANFKKLGGPEIPFKGAFNVTAQFIDPAPKVYKIPSFYATVGDNNQSGWLELDLSAKRPRVKGELSSDNLDLRPLLAEEKEKSTEKAQNSTPVDPKEKKSKTKTESSKSGVQNAKVFSAEPLQLEGLQAIDADLKFRNKQVLVPSLALDDVAVDVLLKDGNLEIKPFNFKIGGVKQTSSSLCGPRKNQPRWQRRLISISWKLARCSISWDISAVSKAIWMRRLIWTVRATRLPP